MSVTVIASVAHARAVRNYAADGDDLLLHDALAVLGFDAAEIQEHIDRPGWRMPEGFAV